MGNLTLAEIRGARWAEGQGNSAMSLETYITYLIYLNSGDTSENFLSLLDAVYQILNDLNKTNNLVSVKEFVYSEIEGSAFDQYNQWITDNPDYVIHNEIYYPKPSGDDAGTQIIMVRFSGEKFNNS